MTLLPSWLDDQNRNLIVLTIPAGGVLVILMDSDPSRGSVAAVLSPEQLAMIEKDSNQLREWIDPEIKKLSAQSQFRLLGYEPAFSNLSPLLIKAGLVPGKSVSLKESTQAHYIPKESRVRLPKESTSPVSAHSPKGTLPQRKIRVLVVDDSETICKLLSKILNDDPEIECVATVGSPNQVQEAIVKNQPDVITLDIHMPEMDGVTLLKTLLPRFSIPTIMISALSMEDGTYVLDALEAGAIDYIQKPSMAEVKVLAPIICEKIKSAHLSKSQIEKNLLPKEIESGPVRGVFDQSYLIAIGSSTGGTEALRQVLTRLPEQIPPILIVQHIPAFFSKAFADRMNQLCLFEVKEAENGEAVTKNKVLIAPGGKQMKVVRHGTELEIVIDDSPPVNRHKPSVDYLFDSIAVLQQRKVAAVILTGMGADGAKGLLKLKQSGARTFAQDEASSIVYGMPKEAARLGGVEQIVPLDRVASSLIKVCGKK